MVNRRCQYETDYLVFILPQEQYLGQVREAFQFVLLFVEAVVSLIAVIRFQKAEAIMPFIRIVCIATL